MLCEWPTLLSERHYPFKFSEVEEEVEIQDVTGIFDVLFSSCTVYSYAFGKIMDKWI